MSRVVVPCILIPVVKIFQFLPNKGEPDVEYPQPFANFFDQIQIGLVYFYFVWIILLGLLDSVIFAIVNFIIDINMIIKLRKAIEEKNNCRTKIALILLKSSEIEKR